MHTESNPQQHAATAVTAEPAQETATPDQAASRATSPKPTSAAVKKPTAKRPVRQKAATSDAKTPTAKKQPTEKPVGKAPATSPASTGSGGGLREGSTMWAILQVLSDAPEPLSPKEIYAQISERKLASGLKGKTPDQSVAAALAVAAKHGRYVERAAPGKFRKLTEERS